MKSQWPMLDTGYWIHIKYPVSGFGFIQYRPARMVEPWMKKVKEKFEGYRV